MHPAARAAYEYFSRFEANPTVSSGLPTHVPPVLEFVCDPQRSGLKKRRASKKEKHMAGRFLVGGFHQLSSIPADGEITCLVLDREFMNDAKIECYAWQQVLNLTTFTSIDNKAITARIVDLQQNLPQALSSSLIGRDIASATTQQASIESLCRALHVRSDAVRRHIPFVKRGGIKVHTYEHDIAKRSERGE